MLGRTLTLALLLTSGIAGASPCPTVMIVLDTSGSMAMDPMGGDTTPSKLTIAKTALDTLVNEDGDEIPFGFTTFAAADTDDCSMGVDVVVDVMDGDKAKILSAIAAASAVGGTNTGPAIDMISALPSMHDSTRPGSYIVLVTDGEPNCPGTIGTETTDPAYTVGAIARAQTAGVKTFVIGFGALPTADKAALDMMAMAGGETCTGSTCNGQQYYAAEDQAGLAAAIAAISSQISGELTGMCDDSCYGAGCPNAGQICVDEVCVANPCLGIADTCAPGSYCYTDGTSAGTCVMQCPATCPAGKSCTLNGCQDDPCGSMTCNVGSSCIGGTCVVSTCPATCGHGLSCINGQCKDDPCRYITCPDGGTCTALVGTCVAPATTTTHARAQGCDFGERAKPSWLIALLLLGFISLRRGRGLRP